LYCPSQVLDFPTDVQHVIVNERKYKERPKKKQEVGDGEVLLTPVNAGTNAATKAASPIQKESNNQKRLELASLRKNCLPQIKESGYRTALLER
jgi:hypothetical protein